jgi:hypothetical protein
LNSAIDGGKWSASRLDCFTPLVPIGLEFRWASEPIIRLKLRIVILRVVLCGFETWSLTLKEEHRMRVFTNRVLRVVFVAKGYKWWEGGEDCIMRSFITCTLHRLLLG